MDINVMLKLYKYKTVINNANDGVSRNEISRPLHRFILFFSIEIIIFRNYIIYTYELIRNY